MTDVAERPLCELFVKFSQLALLDGAAPINNLPGAWYRRIDERWEIAVNGLDHDVLVKPKGGMSVRLLPCEGAVWFNGWVCGHLNPFGGCIGAGQAANEAALNAALDKALEEAEADQ